MRLMRKAGLVVADALDAVRAAVAPGVTHRSNWTASPRRSSASPAPSRRSSATAGRRTRRPRASRSTTRWCTASPARRCCAPATSCPSTAGRSSPGWHGDSAFTVVVPGDAPGADPADADLVGSPRRRCGTAIAADRRGEPPRRHRCRRRGLRRRAASASSRSTAATASGPRCTRSRTCLNYRTRAAGPELKAGHAASPIEPMLTIGRARRPGSEPDEWTVVTADGSGAAHWEHSVALTERGPWVLTARDGGAAASPRSASSVAPAGD